MPDRQTAQMQIDLVVGEHEADALMFADRAAERLPPPRVFDGDRVAAARRAEPAHAMGQARRPEPHLRIAKAFADLPQDAIATHANVVEFDLGVTAGRIAVHRLEDALDRKPGASMSTKNIVAPRSAPVASRVRAITMLMLAPGAPVISHLRPLMTNSSPTRARWFSSASDRIRRRRRSRSSRIRCEFRRAPAAASHRSFCSGVAILLSRLVLPSSGA